MTEKHYSVQAILGGQGNISEQILCTQASVL